MPKYFVQHSDAEIKMFVRDRNKTFTALVVDDDVEAVKRYIKRWGLPKPSNDRVLRAGIYKAVQECTDIPQNIKDMAWEKCIALGFKPTMWD